MKWQEKRGICGLNRSSEQTKETTPAPTEERFKLNKSGKVAKSKTKDSKDSQPVQPQRVESNDKGNCGHDCVVKPD